MTITFKEFLNERKDLTWDGIKRYGVNTPSGHSWTKMSKSELVDEAITLLKKHLDKEVRKNLDFKILKDILSKEKDIHKLYGLLNVIAFRDDFSAKSPYGNYQTMLLQMVSQEKNKLGLYESAEPSEILDMINKELSEMDEDEIEEFGYVLYYEFFDDEETDADDYSDFTLADVQLMIDELGEEMYEEILDLLDELDDEELDEAVSRRMKSQNRNRKKRKFMQTSRAELRRTKQKRKIQARKTKQARKRYYRANKNKIKNYQKSRAEAIKKGTHKVKVRRKA